jgi:hypothetical protein
MRSAPLDQGAYGLASAFMGFSTILFVGNTESIIRQITIEQNKTNLLNKSRSMFPISLAIAHVTHAARAQGEEPEN